MTRVCAIGFKSTGRPALFVVLTVNVIEHASMLSVSGVASGMAMYTRRVCPSHCGTLSTDQSWDEALASAVERNPNIEVVHSDWIVSCHNRMAKATSHAYAVDRV